MIGHVLHWLRRTKPVCPACLGTIESYHERQRHEGELHHKSCVVYTAKKEV